MTAATDTDRLLVERIRLGNGDAWGELIARYEGRLLAFVESRVGRRGTSEDILQDAFIGFLTSVPDYDGRRPLESYLFSICAYKLTDHLRGEGRRPALPLSAGADSSGEWEFGEALDGSDWLAVGSAARYSSSKERTGSYPPACEQSCG